MSGEENKAVVARFYAEVINDRDLDAIDDLLTEDFTHNGEPRGRQGQKQAVEVFYAAFSDLRNEILVSLAEGDLVAAHQRWHGTHDGELMGIPPSGKQVSFPSTAILRIRDGMIAEAIDVVDLAALMGQIGEA